MTNEMEKPVTRGELFGEFLPALMAQIGREFDKRFERADERFEQIDKRFHDMDKRIDLRFAEAHQDMLAIVRGSADEIRHAIRSLDRTNENRHREDLAILDEKYETLPARVKKLEAAVFKRAPLKRRRSR